MRFEETIMSDDISIAAEESVPGVVSKSEVALATDIMLTMVKTAKGVKLYQANSPLLVQFFQELAEKMSAMLTQYSEYKLDVERFELRYKGQLVYENPDIKESLAFRMYSDGIRSIIFRQGLAEWELKDFLEIVNMNAAYSVDDDIVTLLWDKGLPHFTYILEDDYQEIDKQIDEQLVGLSAQRKTLSAFPKDPFSLAAPLAAIPDNLLAVSADNMAALKEFIESEARLRPLEESARILSAILSGAQANELFTEFLEIYLKFARNLFASGEIEVALKMFAFLHRKATASEASAERSRAIQLALGRFWTEEALNGLCKCIDTTEAVSLDGLKIVAVMIGQTSSSALCELLGLVGKMKMRKVLIDALINIARDNPHILLPYFKDSRWYLVRNMVTILIQLKNTALLEQVVTLITHRELRVRKEVLKYLLSVPDPKAKPYILKFLRDEASSMRITAVQLMGRARLQLALKPLIDFVNSEAFDVISISEKKAVYEAIAELGVEKALPLFKKMLTNKFHFNRAGEKEAVICAAAGLQKIPGEESIKLLKEALRAKTRDHHEVIISAIEMLVKAAPVSLQKED